MLRKEPQQAVPLVISTWSKNMGRSRLRPGYNPPKPKQGDTTCLNGMTRTTGKSNCRCSPPVVWGLPCSALLPQHDVPVPALSCPCCHPKRCRVGENAPLVELSVTLQHDTSSLSLSMDLNSCPLNAINTVMFSSLHIAECATKPHTRQLCTARRLAG